MNRLNDILEEARNNPFISIDDLLNPIFETYLIELFKTDGLFSYEYYFLEFIKERKELKFNKVHIEKLMNLYSGDPWRKKLLSNLITVREKLIGFGYLENGFQILIGGSFLNDERAPKDIDIVHLSSSIENMICLHREFSYEHKITENYAVDIVGTIRELNGELDYCSYFSYRLISNHRQNKLNGADEKINDQTIFNEQIPILLDFN